MASIDTKSCVRCNICKVPSDFHKSRRNPDGLSSHCKVCDKVSRERYRFENPGAIRASDKKWKAKTRERARLYAQEYRAKNREAFLAGCRATKKKNPARYLLISARMRAIAKGFEFSITEADVVIPTHCPVFGFPLKAAFEKRCMDSPSLDRIDNSLGYVPGNVAVISYKANMIKGIGTADEHTAVAAWMRETG